MSEEEASDHLLDTSTEAEATPSPKNKSRGKKKKTKGDDSEVPWDPHGPDAKLFTMLIVSGECDPNNYATVREATNKVDQWIEQGKYKNDNIRRKFNTTVEKVHIWLLTGNGKHHTV